MLLALTLIAVGCASDEATKTEQQGSTPAGTTVFSGETYPDTKTRTAIVDHTKGGSAKVNWAATDKVWVKDDASTWRQSGAATFPVAANKAKAMFSLNGTYTGTTHDVIYTNLPITGTPQVEIKAAQSQATPNNFDHAGASGDCAIATAHGGNGGYSFLLDHKSSYLCFLPRCMNVDLGKNIYLTKVTITADKPIAGTFNIAGGSIAGNAPAANSSNTITLTTNNFPLNTTVANVAKNAAYMVIAPGTYNFTIGYTIKDPTTRFEGTITKTLTTFTCEEGKIHDITANLTPPDYDGDHYYMWDAQKQHWDGYEWTKKLPLGIGQPILVGQRSDSYPKNNTDPRWYNEANPGSAATHASCKDLPNANEMSWYVMYGDPRLDEDKVWSSMGHLYKMGMWFKKKSVLIAEGHYNTEKSANNSTDLRTGYKEYLITNNNTSVPTAAEASNYFYLPALGGYSSYLLNDLGYRLRYWSSTACPGPSTFKYAYFLYVDHRHVYVSRSTRYAGWYAMMFE